MTDEAIPEGFTDAFLDWFRERTETAWATYQPRTVDDYVAAHVGGADWQRGTRWLEGLSQTEIDHVERRWSIHFPPDYRRFLHRLHAPDRPLRGAYFAEVIEDGERRSRLVPTERPSFYNWLIDKEALQGQWEGLAEGLQFDIEHDGLWVPSWGQKPSTVTAQRARVGELVAAAPRLIPVYAHRYLLAEPCVEGNPVFSISQSDMIVYGPDLRRYFLVEFANLLGVDTQAARHQADEVTNARSAEYAAIPFSGELWSSSFR
jgi:hypothetical protein